MQLGRLVTGRRKEPDPAAVLAGGTDAKVRLGAMGGALGDARLGQFLVNEGDGERALGEELAQEFDGLL